MRIIKHPVVITLVALASFVYLASLLGIRLPHLISFYLNDLLCMPVVLSICLALIRHFKKDETLYVPLGIIGMVTAYYAFHFEWLLPQFHDRYTADWMDVGLYSVGAFLFYKFQKRLF